MKADLHMHTNFSDGKYSVDELLDLQIKNNIDIISITDHDSFEGVKKAITTKKNIRVIIGIELSTSRNEENVHILGYFKDLKHIEQLQPVLDQQIIRRNERAYRVLEKLKEHFNIDLDHKFIEEVESVTRGTIAREIKKQGYDYTNKIIFKYMIGDGCPGYIPSSKIATVDGVNLIKEAGGLTVVAHPMHLKKNNITDIIKLGVDGLEAKYPHQEDVFNKYYKIAKRHHLFITAGTDFHDFDDGRHGNIGTNYLDGKDLEIFLEALYER